MVVDEEGRVLLLFLIMARVNCTKNELFLSIEGFLPLKIGHIAMSRLSSLGSSTFKDLPTGKESIVGSIEQS